MRFLALTSLLALASASPIAARNKTESRYAIMDNDWSGAASFVPLLMTLKAGVEVLGLVSGTHEHRDSP